MNLDDPNVVSPGILGFLAFFFLAVALYFLVRNMNRHLRRVSYRAEQERQAEQAEQAARAEAAEPAEPAESAGPGAVGANEAGEDEAEPGPGTAGEGEPPAR